jgi:hypothetical protein
VDVARLDRLQYQRPSVARIVSSARPPARALDDPRRDLRPEASIFVAPGDRGDLVDAARLLGGTAPLDASGS